MKGRNSSIFTEIPIPKIDKNLFDLSHEVKGSGKFGYLYPIFWCHCVPGDNIVDIPNIFMRFAPMVNPPMHRCRLKVDAFAVPMRLSVGQQLWENFITGGQDGTLEPVLPYIGVNDLLQVVDPAMLEKGSLWDYMGLPVMEDAPANEANNEPISVIPFRAAAQVWNDWYRDPNLDQPMALNLNVEGSQHTFVGADLWFRLRVRGWERDAFTGALPFAQRGAEVLMPLTGNADVNYAPTSLVLKNTGAVPAAGAISSDGTPTIQDSAGTYLRIENIDSVTISNATSTINDFRTAYALQKWEEANARGGGRYIDQILSQFNVRVPDYRLQRSEYCGGLRQDVRFSEVLSTADTAEVPVGDMAGHGTVFASGKMHYHAEEHATFIVFMSVVPTPSYASQGIEKAWSYSSRFDFATPLLANLGEQEVLSKEVFYSFEDTDQAANQTLFGYNPRYWDWKFKQDRLCGDFRDTLLHWTLSRKFLERPALDSDFVAMNENSTTEETYRRIFAVQDGSDYLWFQIFHRASARRPLSYYGVPSLKV